MQFGQSAIGPTNRVPGKIIRSNLRTTGGLETRSKPMISSRDIDTDVEVVGSRAVESSTWLERGRKPAQTRYVISYVRAHAENL